ncbi:MAG TPA: hypothetical protein VHT27_02975 [Solirubrobacteraceae bacterium]|nr:hypothetical protein [Solirubrobacteraceae bacterium]
MTTTTTYHLALFGPLTLIGPNSDGGLEAREIEGWRCQTLLAALVQNGQRKTRPQLFQQVYDKAPERIARTYEATKVLKTQLEEAWVIVEDSREGLGIADRATLLSDWSLMHELSEAKGDGSAAVMLEIARKGRPLDGIADGHPTVGVFVARLRAEALTLVHRACAALALDRSFQWGDPIPEDWPHVAVPGWPDAVSIGHATAFSPGSRPTERQVSDGIWRPAALFEGCPDGEALRRIEFGDGSVETRWPGDKRWFGEYYAFWHRTVTQRCDEVVLTYVDERYDAERFGQEGALDGDNDKATIIEAKLLGEPPTKRLICARTNWGFAHEWAKDHADDLLAAADAPSAFGVVGRSVYPGIAGVHTLVWTSDGYLLFALRGNEVAFHERTWSASFEESVAAAGREYSGPGTGDATVLDAINGGLVEEWGVEPRLVVASTMLAVGREFVRTRTGRLDLSSTILTAIRLDLPIAQVWECLDRSPEIRDRDEHIAWAGIRFNSREHLLGFLAKARGRRDNVDLLSDAAADVGAEISYYPGASSSGIADYGLMPTSAARLYLGSAWLVQYGHLRQNP